MKLTLGEELGTNARHEQAAGRYRQAADLYRQALSVQPDSADLHHARGMVCFYLDELDMATDHFRRTQELDPKRADAFINLAAVYNRTGRHQDAIAALRHGIQLDPRLATGYFNLAIAYWRLGQRVLAIEAYRECNRLDPRLAAAHVNLADLYVELDRLPEAVAHYQQALALRPHCLRAEQRLQRAKQRSSGRRRRHDRPRTQPAPVAKPMADDPSRFPISDAIRAAALGSLHSLANQGEQLTGRLRQLVDGDLLSALKDLDRSFLQPDLASDAARLAYQKLREALEQFERDQQHLRENGKSIRRHSRRLGIQVSQPPA